MKRLIGSRKDSLGMTTIRLVLTRFNLAVRALNFEGYGDTVYKLFP